MAKYLGESAKDQLTYCYNANGNVVRNYDASNLMSLQEDKLIAAEASNEKFNAEINIYASSEVFDFLKVNNLLDNVALQKDSVFNYCRLAANSIIKSALYDEKLYELTGNSLYRALSVVSSEKGVEIKTSLNVKIEGSLLNSNEYIIFDGSKEIILTKGAFVISPRIFFLNSEPEISIDDTSVMIAKEYHYSTDDDFCDYANISENILEFCNQQALNDEL